MVLIVEYIMVLFKPTHVFIIKCFFLLLAFENEVNIKSYMPRLRCVCKLLYIISKYCTSFSSRIQEALRRISRDDLALAVGTAFENDLPFT